MIKSENYKLNKQHHVKVLLCFKPTKVLPTRKLFHLNDRIVIII